MLLPLGDEPNPRGTPWVTWALILANVAVFVFISLPLGSVRADLNDPLLREYLQAIADRLPPGVSLQRVVSTISAYDLFVFEWGFRPVDPSVATLFTSMFLHGGLVHLFGNMLFLWIYGDNVEHRLGPLPYLFWYLLTGASATLFHRWFDSSSPLPLVGASGAISGVLGFYFVWFPHNRVRLWLFFFPFFFNIVLVPARLVLGLYLIVENLLPFLVTRGLQGSGVAYGAHIGGFAAGLIVAWVANQRSVRTAPAEYRRATPREAPKTAVVVDSTREAIAHAVAAGDMAGAAAAYFALAPHDSRRVLDPRDSLALAGWLHEQGHPRAALAIYQRHIRDYPLGPGTAEAHAGAGLVQLNAFGQATAAYQHFVEALEHDPPAETERLVRAALAEIAARQKFQVRTRTS